MSFVPGEFIDAFHLIFLASFFVPAVISLFFNKKIQKRLKMYVLGVLLLLIIALPSTILIMPLVYMIELTLNSYAFLPPLPPFFLFYIFGVLVIAVMCLIQIWFIRWWIKEDKSNQTK